MQAQTPAKGVSETYNSNNMDSYHIECDCTAPDHSVSTWIEVGMEDEDMDYISVTFYVKTWTPFFTGFWQRIKCAANILFTGVSTQEHGILLKEQNALNWITAVQKSLDKVEQTRNKTI